MKSRTSRAGLRDLLNTIIGKIVYAFNVCRSFVKAQTDTLSQRGQSFINSAQTDLSNLKKELTELWDFKEDQKKTVVLFIANIIGKALYSPCIILLTMLSALVKLSLGFVCMTLGGDLLGFIKKFAFIIRDVTIEGFKILGQYLKGAWKIIREAVASLANKIGMELARLGAAFIHAIEDLGKKIAAAFKAFRNWAAETFKNITKSIDRVIKNLAPALANVARGIAHLIIGVAKAAHIITKGVALSVAALFFETGIATAVSGVAKSIFILEESLAAAIDALMDGVYACGKSVANAAKAMVKSGATPQYQPLATSVDLENPIATETAQPQHNPTHILRDGVHAVNDVVANVGNHMLHSYLYESAVFSLRSTSAWTREPLGSEPRSRRSARMDFV